MARPRLDQPWFHKASGFWCTWDQGKRVYLSKNLAEARRLLAERRQRTDPAAVAWQQTAFQFLADRFLADVQACRSASTYDDYRHSLERAFQHGLDPKLPTGDLKKIHLRLVEQKLTQAKVSPTTVFKTLHAVQRVLSWACEVALLDTNHLAGYKKPRPRQRSRILTSQEFNRLLRHCHPAFRRLLIALRYTGCRPGELARLTWDEVHDSDATSAWILPEHKTLSRQKEPRPRVIGLTPCVRKLTAWIARHQGRQGHVFRNTKGRPWKKDGWHSTIYRLVRRAGLGTKGGESVVLYTTRHTFATAAVGKVSDIELAELLGHTTTRTTRRYCHLDTQRIQDIARRATGS